MDAGDLDRLSMLSNEDVRLGAKRSDRSSELFEIASTIHRILMEGGYRKIRWCIDGYPDYENSTPEPRRSVPGKV